MPGLASGTVEQGGVERTGAWRLLHGGVPLSLLLDLACRSGPDSQWLYQAEQRAAGRAGG